MFQRILVAVDDGEPAERAVKLACEVSRRFNARLALIHVVPPSLSVAPDRPASAPPGRERDMQPAAELLACCRDRLPPGMPVIEYLVRGHPAEQIVRTARQRGADLIVRGDHSSLVASRLIVGDTADEVVSDAPCSVLVARATEPATPDQTLDAAPDSLPADVAAFCG